MIMSEILLNELSLAGQFASLKDFTDSLKELLKIMKYAEEKKWKVSKKSTLFQCDIMPGFPFYKIREDKSDAIRRLKSRLLQMSDTPPYWDVEKKQQGFYYLNDGTNVTDTAIAEAVAREEQVVSFLHEKYADKLLEVTHEDETLGIASCFSLKYLVNFLYEQRIIGVHEFLKIYFKGSRLNFEKFEEEYGFQDFEKHEIEETIEYFERFAQHESWKTLMYDDVLRYKEYQPSSKKKDWFRNSDYEKVHKFRCGNPKRCFGFREGDEFFVLRMERDHSVSDHG